MPAGQLTFDDAPTYRATDPETSRLAGLRPGKQNGRLIALNALHQAGLRGFTDFELAAVTGVQQTSIGKRRFDLMGDGLVEWAGTHRMSDSGASARVWRLTQAGRALWSSLSDEVAG